MDRVIANLCGDEACANETNNTGDYVVNEGFFLSKRAQLENLGKELTGQHFRIATLQNFPLSYAVQENGRWVGKGVAFDFISYLREKYSFDYSVVVPDEDILGTNQTGIFGMLYKGQADIAAAFLPVIPTYWNLVRYSPPLDEGEWVVLMKRPAESATGSGLLAPFTWDVWLLILVFLICVGPVIYSLIKFHDKVCKDTPPTVTSLYGCVWFVYGALLKQGSTIVPIADSTRMLFATWWIFITILTAFYTANLTAFLTLSQFTLPVNQASDIGSKKYSWITRRGNAIDEASRNELEVSFKGSKPHYIEETNDNFLQDYVKKKNFMYLGEKPIVEHMMFNDYLNKAHIGIDESERCTFVITQWAVLLRARAFAYSKKFPYHKLFDDILEHLVESGIVKYKLRVGLPNTQICPLNLGSKERQLRNTDLLLTYYIVSGGFLVALAVFLLELLFKCLCKSKLPITHVKQAQDKLFEVPIHPPPYHTLFEAPFNFENGEKRNINGRDYWVVRSDKGKPNIVPIRAPSALLFQYTH